MSAEDLARLLAAIEAALAEDLAGVLADAVAAQQRATRRAVPADGYVRLMVVDRGPIPPGAAGDAFLRRGGDADLLVACVDRAGALVGVVATCLACPWAGPMPLGCGAHYAAAIAARKAG